MRKLIATRAKRQYRNPLCVTGGARNKRAAKGKEVNKGMSRRNSVVVPEARQSMEQFKTEVANSLNVDLKQGYNGDLTSRQAGSIGGEMVKRMIKYAENNMSNN